MGRRSARTRRRTETARYESIVSEILEQAEQTDREEDERYGDARGDELPEQLRTREGRRAALAAAREKLERARAAERDAGQEVVERMDLELDPEQFVTRSCRATERGFVRAAGSWSGSASRRPGRSPAPAPSAWWKRSGDWKRSSRSSMPLTVAMRAIGRAGR